MRSCLIGLLCLVAMACSTNVKTDAPSLDSPYHDVLESFTSNGKVYKDFETRAVVNATEFSPVFAGAYLGERKLNMSLEKFQQFAERETTLIKDNLRFFVSLYTPNSDNNDLDQPTSMWTVYIEKKDGSKISPLAIVGNKESFDQIRHYFPYHDYWSSAYYMNFPRLQDGKPILNEGDPYSLVIHSVVGTMKIEYTYKQGK